MFSRCLPIVAVWCLGIMLLLCSSRAQEPDTGPSADQLAEEASVRQQVQEQVDDLLLSLAGDTIAERDIAEQNLLKLGDLNVIPLDDFLALLPAADANLPPAVRERVQSIRAVLENRRAKEATAGTKVTVTAAGWKLSELLAELEKQTGNKVVDSREQFGQEATDPKVTVVADDLPFWSVLDQALDQANVDLYGYGDQAGAMQLTAREPGRTDRYGMAHYSGPFRFEPYEVVATRGLRNKATESLRVDLEIAWEPRLQPIALALPIDSVAVDIGGGTQLATTQPGRVFNVEVQPGTQNVQLNLPFELPARNAAKIQAMSGTLLGLLPGSQEEFEFNDLKSEKAIKQTKGGVAVTLDRVRKNNAIWEVHMRLKLADDNDALASHRGWVFANTTYLVDKDDNIIDHAGFETTMQTEDEVGIAYLFDLPDGIEGMKWIYKSPAAIVEQSFDFELKDIPLP